MRGLKGCEGGDLILISDVDEIVRGSDVRRLKEKTAAELRFYRYEWNRRAEEEWWVGPVAVRYEYLAKRSPQEVRDRRHEYRVVKDAGWHFSSMGGLDAWRYKLESFAHVEANVSERKEGAWLEAEVGRLREEVVDEGFPERVRRF